MARKRTEKNVFDKPDDQWELAHTGMARKRTEKNVFDKPDDQWELAHTGMARKRTEKNVVYTQLLSYPTVEDNVIPQETPSAPQSGATVDASDHQSSSSPTPPKPRRSLPGRLLRIAGWCIGGVLLLLVVCTLLLYYPPIQKAVVNRVVGALQSTTGMDIHVGEVRVGFPVRLHIGDVVAVSTDHGDTVAVVDQLTAQLGIRTLLQDQSLPLSALQLRGTKLDYHTPSDSLVLTGEIGELTISSASYGLRDERIVVGQVRLRDSWMDVIALSDTIPAPKPEKKTKLVITVDQLELDQVRWSFASSLDSVLIGGYVSKGILAGGVVDLPGERYGADRIELQGTLTEMPSAIEPMPLPWDFDLQGHSAYYAGSSDIVAEVDRLRFGVGSGQSIHDLAFRYTKDSTRMVLSGLALDLGESSLEGEVRLPFEGWQIGTKDEVQVELHGALLPDEVLGLIGLQSREAAALHGHLIDMDISAQGPLSGTVDYSATLSADEIIDLSLSGQAVQPMDSIGRSLEATFRASTYDGTMPLLTKLLAEPAPARKGTKAAPPELGWQIPAGTRLEGKASLRGSTVQTHMSVRVQEATLTADAKYAMRGQSYEATLKLSDLSPSDFVAVDSIQGLSAIIVAKGRGTDPFAQHTTMSLFAKVDTVSYRGEPLSDITLLSELKEHRLFAALQSSNRALGMTAQVDAVLKRDDLEGSINLFVDSIAPQRLGISLPVVQGGQLELRSSIRSDLKQYYDFGGEIENFVIHTNKGTLYPTNTYLSAYSSDSTMSARVASGDLIVDFKAQNGLDDFTSRISKLAEVVQTSLQDTTIRVDMSQWMTYYPDMDLKVSIGRNNLLRTYLDQLDLGVQRFELDLTTRAHEGIRGDGFATHLRSDTFRIDAMDLILRQDSSFFYTTATVHKERYRTQAPFDIVLSLTSNVHRSEAYLNWQDERQKDFVKIGVELWSRPNQHMELGFTPDPIVLAGNTFRSEGGGYLRWQGSEIMKPQADIRLVSPDGALIALRDLPTTDGAHHLHADIDRFRLTMLKSLNLLPPLSGILDADVDMRTVPSGAVQYDLTAGLERFRYDDRSIGDVRVAAVAQQSEGTMSLSGTVGLDGADVAELRYHQHARATGATTAPPALMALWIKQLSLEKANPFLPEKMARLSGTLDADVSNFDTSQQIVSATPGHFRGHIRMSDATCYVPMLNETYSLDSQPIEIIDGRVRLSGYAISAGDSQLVADGTVELSPKLPIELRLYGQQVQLLDAQPSPDAMLYGRLNADAQIDIHGPASALNITGMLTLNGSTDVTYQSQKSDLQKRNNYAGLVEYVDFADTLLLPKATATAVDSITLGGTDINLRVHIAPAARVTAILNRSGSNRVSIQGGGDFNFTMPPYGTMQLSGMYQVSEGQVAFAFGPMARRFDVVQGSSLTWSGELLKPVIDFRATSRVASRVATADEPTRQVNFDVSVIAENSLDDLKLRFEMEAPEDLAMANRLKAMSDDEQSRQAVILLGTGYFMGAAQATGQNSTEYINSALTSLLASQLNSLAGEALNAEINFGVSDGSTLAGQGTNYSYSISKRFFNNRINFVVGGKVVTGQVAEGLQQTIIDNMTLEYRLDENGSHFLRLFHKKNFENLFDGEVTETGIGYLIRRRLSKLTDLFIFKRRPHMLPDTTAPDSIPTIPLLVESTLVAPKDSVPATEPTDLP